MFLKIHWQLHEHDKKIKKGMYQNCSEKNNINWRASSMSSGYNDDSLQLFTLNSNRKLSEEIAKHIGIPLGKCSVSKFSDGETQINIEESVRGCDVYVVQSTSDPVNDHLMELLILIDALK